MAVSAFKTFAGGEILTASDLNSSFSQVFDNGEDLGWPATKEKNFADNNATRCILKDYGEVTNAIGSIGGGTQDIDLEQGNSVTATVDTSATTFTFSNPTASPATCSFVLFLTNGGSQTVTWPGAVTWVGGSAPTLKVSGVDILYFTTTDAGTTWYGLPLLDVESAVAGQRKNMIVNGKFDFWQHGTSSSSAEYLADQFRTAATGSTYTTSQQSFTVGQTDVPFEPEFFHRTVVTSSAGAGNQCKVTTRLEGARLFAGQTATLSFYAKADASKNIATEFIQNFGTGGSSAVTGTGVTTHALTSSWAKFTATVTLPSISGKTIGTAGDDYVDIQFWMDAGSDFDARTNTLGQQSGTFDIALVQLESGPVATDFQELSKSETLAECRRFFIKSYNTGTALGSTDTNGIFRAEMDGSTIGASVQFPQTMRGDPTIQTYDEAGAAGFITTAAGDGQSATVSREGEGGFYVAKGSTPTRISFHWTADATL